ncbi:MAG TPA: hypothetical protein VI248_29170 [Kineosporiaceae bacterium]
MARIHQAVCRFRRLWWGMLTSRPGGFPVGWACTDREIDAIDRAPTALGQNPGLRIIARDEPLHPKYTKTGQRPGEDPRSPIPVDRRAT